MRINIAGKEDPIEEARLKALKNYQILDTGPENEYDAITRLASYICNMPMSLITLTDDERTWVKSSMGLDVNESPRELSFCQYTILQDNLLEIKDARNDLRVADNAAVTGDLQVRYYAGAPLIDPKGNRIGSLCVIDTKPNELNDQQKEALKILANEVISHLEVAKTNRELKESLASYQEIYTMFNNSGELHCILNNEGKILMINNAVEKILGYTVKETTGENMWNYCLKEDKDKVLSTLEKGLKSGQKQLSLETRIQAKNGEIRWIGWNVNVQKKKWFTNGRDITYEKQIAAEVEQLSSVASKVNNGIAISDSNNEVLWVNDAFEKITGYRLEHVKGRKLGDIIKGENTDESVISYARESTRNKQSFSVDLLAYRKNGDPIWLSVMNSVIVNEAGEVERGIEIITDITDRKQTEQQLETLSLVASKSSSGAMIRSKTGEVLWMNEALENIFGFTLEEIQGKSFGTLLMGPGTDMAVFEAAKQAVVEKRSYEIEILIYKKDGTPTWIFISNTPIFDNDGEMERQVGIVVDITERKETEKQLTLLSLVASKTINGVVINDDKGCIKWVNDSFEEITGYKLSEVKGKMPGDIFTGEATNIEDLERVRQLSRSKKSFNIELLNYKKDGSPIWVSVSNTPIFNKDGSVEQEIEIVNDISERKNAEIELIKTREEALQLSKAKEMLLSVMSHEIRTPLNGVIGMIHLLTDDNPTESQLENLNIMKFSAENLLCLLNDILDFTKIETGNLHLEDIDVKLKNLVSQTVNSLVYKTREKGVALTCEIDPKIPNYIRGDNTRLYQIVMNLLSNSIKFTEKGEIKLKLDLVEEDENSVSVKFELSDTGIGIPADKLDYIFEAYTQAKANTSRKYGGTGLGLAITKRLIELYNSKIHVISKENQGSRFIFTIKFQRSQKSDMQIENNNSVPKQFSSVVLVVDDNDINRLLAKKVLAKWGISTDFAENGQIALDRIKDKHYDLVFMDIQMPVMDGFEAVRHIREMEDQYYKDLPIIALTASIMTSDLEEIKKSGMDDYILKPFLPDDLYSKINTYL